jgi:hypothetical protein
MENLGLDLYLADKGSEVEKEEPIQNQSGIQHLNFPSLVNLN